MTGPHRAAPDMPWNGGAGRPRRIEFVLGSLGPGGAERFATNLANHWVAQGHEVGLVELARRDRPAYAIDDRVRLTRLDDFRPSRSAAAALRSGLARTAALRRHLRHSRPDACIGVMTYANCLLALAGGGSTGARLGSEHIYPPMLDIGPVWQQLRRWLYGRLYAVVVLTEESSEWIDNRTRARRTEVIPIPLAWPLVRDEPMVPPGQVVRQGRRLVLGIGRLAPQKRFDRLLEAFTRVAAEAPGWDLAILGEGEERAALEGQVAEAGLGGRVHLVGRVGNVADWLERADLVALSSAFEGFPNVLIEALAYGVPVVSVDCLTGPRQIVRDGIDGLLVAEDDGPALAAGLTSLMRNEALRRRFAARAVEARERFALPHIAAMWEEVIADARAPG